MLHRLIAWLSARRGIATVILVAYFLLVSLGHELVQTAAFWAYKRYSLTVVNRVIFHLGWVASVFLLLWCAWRWRPNRRGCVQLGYAALLFVLAYAALRWLFYTPIEIVHFPQYALLAIFLFPLTRRFSTTLFFLTLFSTADEALQYFNAMQRGWGSLLDFNDIFLNLIGGCAGCLLIHLDRGDEIQNRQPLRIQQSSILWTCVGLVMAASLLYALGVLRIFKTAGGTHALLYLYTSSSLPVYWHTAPSGRPYHNLAPWEALPLFAAVIWAFSLLPRWTNEPKRSAL